MNLISRTGNHHSQPNMAFKKWEQLKDVKPTDLVEEGKLISVTSKDDTVHYMGIVTDMQDNKIKSEHDGYYRIIKLSELNPSEMQYQEPETQFILDSDTVFEWNEPQKNSSEACLA